MVVQGYDSSEWQEASAEQAAPRRGPPYRRKHADSTTTGTKLQQGGSRTEVPGQMFQYSKCLFLKKKKEQ
jgi:hypothetical protein